MVPDVIQRNELFTLVAIHVAYLAIAEILAYYLLPGKSRYRFIGLATMAWGWSMTALLSFYFNAQGFLKWFFDPSAEKNFMAISSSIMLALIGLTALILLWHSRKRLPRWQMAYWLVLAITFLFLALDEYVSIHETIIFWRQMYLGLGGSVGLLSLVMLFAGEKSLRPYLITFLFGLGSMGFAGVILDAFSNQAIIDIGSYNLDFLACPHYFLGVRCLQYANTEEMLELIGAMMMWQSLMGIAYSWLSSIQQRDAHRFLRVVGGLWAFMIIGWLWVFPSIETRLIATPATTRYEDLTLSHYAISQETIQPGDELEVTLYIHSNHRLSSDYSASVHLFAQPDTRSVAQADMQLGENEYPTEAWFPNFPIRNRFLLKIPEDLPTGQSYQIVAMIWHGDASVSLTPESTMQQALFSGEAIVLQTIPALPENVPAAPDTPIYHFSEGFSLVGYEFPPEAHPGDVITTRFWWKSDVDITTPLTHFIHATNTRVDELFGVDTSNANRVENSSTDAETIQQLFVFDQIPFGGRFPSQDWPAGLTAMDEWEIALPADLFLGTYRIQMGMYNSFTIERMAITDDAGNEVPDAAIVLGELQVTAP